MANLQKVLLAAVLGLTIDAAVAVPVTVKATGSVTQVFVSDPFGTTVGDHITLQARFDSSALVGIGSLAGISVPGVQFASLSADPSASLTIALGTRIWDAHSEPFFGSDVGGFFPTPLPHLVLVNGAFIGLNFFGIGPSDDVLLSDSLGQLYFGLGSLGDISGGNSNPNDPPFWVGAWDLANSTVTVPEPGTVPLLLLPMLLAASGFRRLTGSRRNRGGTQCDPRA